MAEVACHMANLGRHLARHLGHLSCESLVDWGGSSRNLDETQASPRFCSPIVRFCIQLRKPVENRKSKIETRGEIGHLRAYPSFNVLLIMVLYSVFSILFSCKTHVSEPPLVGFVLFCFNLAIAISMTHTCVASLVARTTKTNIHENR